MLITEKVPDQVPDQSQDQVPVIVPALTSKKDAKSLYFEFHMDRLKKEGNLKLHDIKTRV